MSAGPQPRLPRARRWLGLAALCWLAACEKERLELMPDAASPSADAAEPGPADGDAAAPAPERDAELPDGDGGGVQPPGCSPHALPPPCGSAACPPPPPACGPGSQDYPHVSAAFAAFGEGAERYWVYEPSEPRPESAPVVVYLHAFGVFEPSLYDAQLRHLARKGFVVVFPLYGFFEVESFEPSARRATAAAWAELKSGPDHVRPNGQLALVGHSLGALLALRLAADSTSEPPLPAPAVLVLHDPAGSEFASYDISKEALAGLPGSTRLLVIQAEASVDQPNSDALALFEATESLPPAHKNFLRVYSDTHGTPTLLSDHLGVQSGQDVLGVRPLDAIDWWGYARPTEGALAEALGAPFEGYSAFCRAAGASCDAVRDAGKWSDGVPVKRLANAGDLDL